MPNPNSSMQPPHAPELSLSPFSNKAPELSLSPFSNKAPELSLSPFSNALSVLAGETYVQLDESTHSRFHPLHVRPTSAPSLADPFFNLHCSTWKPKGSFFFTLIKTHGDTVVYCHDNDTAYVAAPCAKLASACPVGTALLAQWCLDKAPDGALTPRLLVFDLLDADPNPSVRGARLRVLGQFLPQPLCVVQWSGQAAALDKFASTLPHEVDYFLHLTHDPLHPHRHLTITLPPPCVETAEDPAGE